MAVMSVWPNIQNIKLKLLAKHHLLHNLASLENHSTLPSISLTDCVEIYMFWKGLDLAFFPNVKSE
jgi:hypothetical protein